MFESPTRTCPAISKKQRIDNHSTLIFVSSWTLKVCHSWFSCSTTFSTLRWRDRWSAPFSCRSSGKIFLIDSFSIPLEPVWVSGLHSTLSLFSFWLFWSPFLQPQLAPAEKTIRFGPGCRLHTRLKYAATRLSVGLHTHSSNLSFATFIQHRA